MPRWLDLEYLVAHIHLMLDGEHFTVEHGVKITEPHGARAQIDVVLRPKSPLMGPVFVSCKSSGERVGVDHVREWSDIVAHAGAAAGVIVSPAGFTADAIEAASVPARRISLWVPRAFTDEDFAPDASSPGGYLRSIHTTLQPRVAQVVPGSLVIDLEPASGQYQGITIDCTFSAATRAQYYLRDAADNVVGNLWDECIKAGKAVCTTSTMRVEFNQPRFLVLQGHRVRFNFLTAKISVATYSLPFEIDFSKESFGYQNAVTQELRTVPLPARMLNLE